MASIESRVAGHIKRLLPEWIAFRHRLHAWPEPAFEEHETAKAVAERLEALPGMQIRRGVGGTGIVADLDSDRPGPCLALRADMDALPMQETADRPYASQRPGFMHACGHDGHTACLVGAAEVLAACRDALPGPVRFIFQPAEEGGGGALKMRNNGALDHPRLAAIYAMHGLPLLPLGDIDARIGIAYASTDALDIQVTGSGTHAASPHKGVDPILVAAHIITGLQGIVSRQTAPCDPLVITVASIHGGTARNVIPPAVALQGTLRALDGATRTAAAAAIRRVATHTAEAYGATADVTIRTGYPLLRNHAGAVHYVARTAASCPAMAFRAEPLPPTLGGEDFAYFLEEKPGAMWRLGLNPRQGPAMPPLHHPAFDFPDDAIPLGVRLHCELALQFAAFDPSMGPPSDGTVDSKSYQAKERS